MESPPIRPATAEDDLARRIAVERERRGWSYADMAERMTAVGCSMQLSTVYKSEKGAPRRRVTVRELAGYAEVFGLSVEELLAPHDLSPEAQAQRLTAELVEPWHDTFEAVTAIALRLAQIAELVETPDDPRPGLVELLEDFERQDFWTDDYAPIGHALRELLDSLVSTYLGQSPDVSAVSGDDMLEDEGSDGVEHREAT